MEGQRLHVADLDSRASKWDLEEIFKRFGPVLEIWMAKSVPCFAFVVFKRKEDAYEACRAADGQDICGRRVRVTMARSVSQSQSDKFISFNFILEASNPRQGQEGLRPQHAVLSVRGEGPLQQGLSGHQVWIQEAAQPQVQESLQGQGGGPEQEQV